MSNQKMGRSSDRDGPRRLAKGSLKPINVLAIAVAAISPTTSVFLVYGAGLASAGTGVIWAFIIGGLIAIGMALSYAEVGSVFPSAGGAYTIVRKALGPVWGGLTNVLFLVLGIVVTASILVAAATYLSSLVPALPVNWTALAMMAVVTLLSLERISPTSWVTAGMLVLELAVILIFTAFAFAHPSLHSNPITHPVLATGHGNALELVGIGGLLVAVVPALFAYNGYDWPLYFAEESSNAKRALPRAVILAAAIAIVVELAAVVGATFAIKNLGAVTASSAPLSLIAEQVMGSTGAKILLIGVVIAMFDTGLAGNLAYARIYYASGRDQMWPGPLNKFFTHISPRTQVPTFGFLVLFVGNGILSIFTSLNNLITFTGVIIVVIYLLVAISALVSRVRDKGLERGFRMPLWPIPPLVAIIGVAIALTQQVMRDLIITGVIVVASVAYYTVNRRRLLEVSHSTVPEVESPPEVSTGEEL
ncbi:MAG: APC family permease [Ferrimicrobium sp.]